MSNKTESTVTTKEADDASARFVPTLRLRVICERLGFTLRSEQLARLGIDPMRRDRMSALYSEEQFAKICDAIAQHAMQVKAAHRSAESPQSDRHQETHDPKTSLVLAVCKNDMTSYGGFTWPSQVGAVVEAPDWDSEHQCGDYLHGWLYGHGELDSIYYGNGQNAKWLVLEADSKSIVQAGTKCKFPSAIVRFIGSMHEAATHLVAHEPRSAGGPVIGRKIEVPAGEVAEAGSLSTITGGDFCHLTGGDLSSVTGGEFSTVTGGHRCYLAADKSSILTGGLGSIMRGGDGSTMRGGLGSHMLGGAGCTMIGGAGSTMIGGAGSTMRSGASSTMIGGLGCAMFSGNRSVMTGGALSTMRGGDGSTMMGGDRSTMIGGDGSTMRGGDGSRLRISYWDDRAERKKIAFATVGKGGIQVGVAYRLNELNKFEEVSE